MATIEEVVPQPLGLKDLGRFLTAAERTAYVQNGTPLALRAVVHDMMSRYGARWIVSAVDLTSGEAVAIGMADSPIRDAQFTALATALADGAEIAPVVIVEVGKRNARAFRSATADQLAAIAKPKGRSK